MLNANKRFPRILEHLKVVQRKVVTSHGFYLHHGYEVSHLGIFRLTRRITLVTGIVCIYLFTF